LDGLNGVGGNISEDPLFCGGVSDPDIFGDRFTLAKGSPCLPGVVCGLIGAREEGKCAPPNNLSKDGNLQESSWGELKGKYK
jgi:hypothetical protein